MGYYIALVACEDLKIEDFTPVMQQFLRARQKLGVKSLLLFRMGDFYESFFEDAELIAKELEITLTGRPEQNYPGGRIPMAGVPARAVKPYIAKLLERNYKIYIAEQMADPKTCKGLVPREITKVFTPGTICDLDLLESYKNNFIMALCASRDQTKFGIAFTDISTGEFFVCELEEKYLAQEINRIQPAEILVPSKIVARKPGQIVGEEKTIFNFENPCFTIDPSPYNEDNFDIDLARQNLSSVFEINSVDKLIKDSFGTTSEGLGLKSAGAVIEYLKETQALEFANNISKNFDVIKTYQVSEFMMMDSSTRRNLELVKNLSGGTEACVFSALDRTCSKAGRRKLRSWLEQPLLDVQAISARQSAIKELIANSSIQAGLKASLSKTYDIDRLSNRLISELISPRELLSLKDSLLRVIEISAQIQSFESGLLTSLKSIPQEIFDFCRTVENAIIDDPGLTITEGGIFKRAYSQELDEYIMLVEDSESWMTNYEEQEKNRLGIKLKVAFNKIHGYFIETSRLNEKKIPEDYIVKQTMVNTIRAVTSDLQEFEEKIVHAESRRNALEYRLYSDLRVKLANTAALIKQIGLQVAQLDALLSMAILAIEQNYVCPILDTTNELDIREGRHLVVEQKLKLGQFVPNDLKLSCEPAQKIMILTGPNMAGKSTYMRQNALIIILAQMGSYVPASYARIGIVDRIFTRIGASDDLSQGQSTFMVEMTETANIINGMSPKSFIVLDEIGRGTSTYDGVAIAWSIVEHLAKNLQPRTIFATHYHELAGLEHLYSSIKNSQVLVIESDGHIEFLHKVAPGSADKSYGIEVARLAGLPKSILDRARAINNQLQAQKSKKLAMNKRDLANADLKLAINDDGSLEIDKLPLFKEDLKIL
jgi:DNA mismatch repair protein MutS